MLTAQQILDATTLSERQDPWKDYERQLKNHDWYYDRSDDYKQYAKGRDQKTKLRELFVQLKQIDTKKAEMLWNKYAPDFFKLK